MLMKEHILLNFTGISWQVKIKQLKPGKKHTHKAFLFREWWFQGYEKSRTLYYNKNHKEFLKIVMSKMPKGPGKQSRDTNGIRRNVDHIIFMGDTGRVKNIIQLAYVSMDL